MSSLSDQMYIKVLLFYRIVQDYLTVLPCRLRLLRIIVKTVCTFTVYISCSVMASGEGRNSQSAGDPCGKTFWCEMRTSWDPPKTYVDLASPGVVVMDTTIVPDVVDLHAFDDRLL